ncbi:MAG: IS4 family transposase [Bacteroidia bacterium]|jgi:hypothetical protein
MNQGKYIFSQVVSFLDANDFKKCTDRYDGNYKVKQFTCWNQLLCMMFGQLSNRDSLSDLLLCLKTQRNKWYHLGLGNGISKSNLAYANEHRDWQIFADFASLLIAQARAGSSTNRELDYVSDHSVFAIDTTTIDLCLSVFWWAKFRKYKGAIRLHTILDVKTEIPCYMHITDGKVHEVNILDRIAYEAGGFYVMDRGYIDWDRLYNIHKNKAYFVSRAKTNMKFKRVASSKVSKSDGIRCDQTIKLANYYADKDFPENFRRIKYFDEETKKEFVFITNNFELTPLQIAHLYKHRWKIELFFKWIKQHLKVKSFWGYSENAVKVQVYCALITFLTVVIVKQKMNLSQSHYEILQILSITILNRTPLNQLFEDALLQDFKEQNNNQLKMF